MNWRPAEASPHETIFEKARLPEGFRHACSRFRVRPVTPNINGGYFGQSAGALVQTDEGRQLWLKVFGMTSPGHRRFDADITADALTGIAKPMLVERITWVDDGAHWVARLTTVADKSVEENPWAGSSNHKITDDWIAELKQSLDVLAEQPATHTHVSCSDLKKWLADVHRIEHDFPESEWHHSHNDLNWSNLTAPKLSILDWEWHGLSPVGFDAGLLIAYACKDPQLVERLERAFRPHFDTFTGCAARAFATHQLQSAATTGWLDPTLLVPLNAMLERLNKEVMLSYAKIRKQPGHHILSEHQKAGNGTSVTESTNRIAAVIPLYNGSIYIREALASVLAQVRQADEIIVVDDGSTDDGASIVASIAATNPKVTLLTKKNGGQGSARNFGVQHSTSNLIAFLDQDDIWYPHHLAELEKPFLEKSEKALGWSYSNLDEVNGVGQMVCYSVLDTKNNEHPKRTLTCCLGQDMFILPGASLVSREAFDAVGGFDNQLAGYEDDDLFLRMFCRGYHSVYIDEALTLWRIHARSTSYGRLMAQSRMHYFRKLVAMFPNEPALNRYYAKQCFVPRFVRSVKADIRRSVSLKDREGVVIACSHLRILRQHLSFRKRTSLRMLAFISRLRLASWALGSRGASARGGRHNSR